jgi:hypothetical protein
VDRDRDFGQATRKATEKARKRNVKASVSDPIPALAAATTTARGCSTELRACVSIIPMNWIPTSYLNEDESNSTGMYHFNLQEEL